MPDVFRRPSAPVFGALILLLLLAGPGAASARAEVTNAASPHEEISGALTLHESLSLAVLHNPELAIYSQEIRAREAEALQAGLRRNPLLSFEAENVFGSGPFSGTDAAESTLSISQTLELGKKRSLRRHLAEAETNIAQNEFALAKTDLLARTTDAFIAVLEAQERLRLAEEMGDLAKRVLGTVEERVAAGRGAETEAIRPRIQLREQQVARDKARGHLVATRGALAALMGREGADSGPVIGDLSRLSPLPDQAELERRLTESPQFVRRIAESERRRRAVHLEEARRIPDLDLGIGARYLRESDDTALVLGVSVPLPLFDRNQGAIAAARSRQTQACADERSALLQAKAALVAGWQEINSARAEAEALRDDIIPASRQAMESAEYGYRAGKFGILDVLDAQRTLVEAQESYLDALTAFHRAASQLERLLGSPLSKTSHNPRLSATVKE
ncbi:MAG: TolC family protein [Desulfuromonadales bacterium]|nr:TolC family protein [Desulfuromonadales bacterium]